MKRIKFLFLIITLFLNECAIAQNTNSSDGEKKSYLSLGIGPSVPLAEYASKDFADPQSGYANIGPWIHISYARRIGERFGATGLLFGNINSFDEATIEFYYPVDFTSDPWKNAGVMLGGYYTSGSPDISFEMRLMLGYFVSVSPAATVRGFDDNDDPLKVYFEEAMTGALCGDLGLGLKTRISDRVSFIAMLDFMVAEPEYTNTKTYRNDLLYSVETYSQPMSTMNLSIGIAINLK